MLVKFKKIILMIGFIAATLPQISYGQEELLDAKIFYQKCSAEGATKVVDGITHGFDHPIWDAIIDKISSGEDAWIKTLYCLKDSPGYSNVTVSVDLDIALAKALPKNPQAVLALSLSGIATARACSLPIIEPKRAWAAQYVKDTLAALEAIPDDASFANILLDIERDVCILRLKDAYAKKYDYAD